MRLRLAYISLCLPSRPAYREPNDLSSLQLHKSYLPRRLAPDGRFGSVLQRECLRRSQQLPREITGAILHIFGSQQHGVGSIISLPYPLQEEYFDLSETENIGG